MGITPKEHKSSSVRLSHPVFAKGCVIVKALERKTEKFIITVQCFTIRILETSLHLLFSRHVLMFTLSPSWLTGSIIKETSLRFQFFFISEIITRSYNLGQAFLYYFSEPLSKCRDISQKVMKLIEFEELMFNLLYYDNIHPYGLQRCTTRHVNVNDFDFWKTTAENS